MHHRPFPHQMERPGGQFAFQDRKGLDSNRCFELAILRVKMRRRVVVIKHADKDSIKGADGWHFVSGMQCHVTPIDPHSS